MSNYNQKVGQKIYDARIKKEITLKELGNLVGLSESTIQRYEKGKIKNVDIDVVKRFANALEIQPTYLLGWNSTIEFDSGYSVGFSDVETKYLSLFDKIHKSTPETAEEHIKLFKKNYNNFISLIGDINIESLNLFMDYIEKTFPEYKFQLNIEEIKSLYEDVKKYTEFSLKKIANKKEVQEYLLPVAAHNDNLGEEQQEKMKRDMIKIKNNKNNKNI